MKMRIDIFRNNKKVNEIISEDPTEIYKKIAEIYRGKDEKTTTRTTIKTSWGEIHEATQLFNQDRTQINGTNYTYKYYFENVKL